MLAPHAARSVRATSHGLSIAASRASRSCSLPPRAWMNSSCWRRRDSPSASLRFPPLPSSSLLGLARGAARQQHRDALVEQAGRKEAGGGYGGSRRRRPAAFAARCVGNRNATCAIRRVVVVVVVSQGGDPLARRAASCLFEMEVARAQERAGRLSPPPPPEPRGRRRRRSRAEAPPPRGSGNAQWNATQCNVV